ncbi:MAG: hypothetical protein ACK5QC_01855 [Bacteroidota bacterium]
MKRLIPSISFAAASKQSTISLLCRVGSGWQPLINGTKIKDTSTYDFATPAFHYGSFQVGVNY